MCSSDLARPVLLTRTIVCNKKTLSYFSGARKVFLPFYAAISSIMPGDEFYYGMTLFDFSEFASCITARQTAHPPAERGMGCFAFSSR